MSLFYLQKVYFRPPMQFADIIGQKEVKQQLAELVQHNRLSHALLFLGKEGTGALSLALAFAQFLVCEKSSPRSATKKTGEISLFGEPAPEPEPTMVASIFDSCTPYSLEPSGEAIRCPISF